VFSCQHYYLFNVETRKFTTPIPLNLYEEFRYIDKHSYEALYNKQISPETRDSDLPKDEIPKDFDPKK